MKIAYKFLAGIMPLALSLTVSTVYGKTDVGTAKGSFSVSPLGGAVYSVSIDTPPGIGAMTPSVNVVYNSQGGNDIAGYGFSISGLSTITTGSKDISHDDRAKGMSFDYTDAFYLDGKRLLLQSGTEGAEGAVYQLESDPFTTVIVHIEAGSSTYIWFEVKGSNGVTYQYGNDISSSMTFKKSGVFKKYIWYITKMEDLNGNFIEYTYTKDNNYVYPQFINYGQNSNTNNFLRNSVKFEYENRSNDCPEFKIGDTKVVMKQRLKSITTQCNTSIYRKYEFQYNQTPLGNAKYSILSKITVKNRNGDELSPTVFNWNTLPSYGQTVSSPNMSIVTSTELASFEQQFFICSDVNGDGIADVLQIAPTTFKYPGGNIKEMCNMIYLFRSSVSSDGSISYARITEEKLDAGFESKNLSKQFYAPGMFDFDGDGLGEFIIPQLVKIKSSCQLQFFCPMGKNMKQGNLGPIVIPYDLVASKEMPLYTTVDTRNDGRDDVVILEKNKASGKYPGVIIYYSDQALIPKTNLNLTLPSAPKALYTGDYNTDGLKDLMVVYDGGYTIYWNGSGSSDANTFTDSNKTSGTTLKYSTILEQGDFNGDGVMDFLMGTKNSSNWYIYSGNNNGTFTCSSPITIDLYDQSTDKDDNTMRCMVFDFDNDGKSDVLIVKDVYDGNKYLRTADRWLQSTGTSFTAIRSGSFNGEGKGSAGYFMLGDFTGNGHVELMNYGSNCYAHKTTTGLNVYRNTGYSAGSGKVYKIQDGLSNTIDITYGSLPNSGVYAATNSTSVYPMVDVMLPLHVVKATTSTNGAGPNLSCSYRYGGLKAHMKGRGLLGFTTSTTTNTTLGSESKSVNTWDTANDFGIPKKTTVTSKLGSETTTAETTYTITKKAKRNYIISSYEQKTTDFDGNVTKTTNAVDATYGCAKYTITQNAANTQYCRTDYSDPVKKGNIYLPQTIKVRQKHVDDTNEYTTTEKLSYDAKGRITNRTVLSGTPKAVTTVYTYDGFGNVLSEKSTGTGLPNITKKYDYNRGQSVSKIYTVPETTTIYYSYDDLGLLVKEEDRTYVSSYIITQYEYDGWSRLVKTKDPTGVVTNVSYGSGSSQAKKYYVLEEPNNAPWVKTWYDACGREVATESVGLKGINISSTIKLDSKGRTSTITSVTGDQTLTETFTYDSRNRMKSDVLSSGAQTTYTYGNRSVTVKAGGKQYTRTFDEWGNILTSSSPLSNSVTFTYSSMGMPVKVKINGNNNSSRMVTMEYDVAGNRTMLKDPDAGQTTYVYDACHLLSETDARNVATTYTYDTYGRLSKETVDGVATEYTYGTSGYDKMRLTQLKRGNNVHKFSYDSYGRVKEETRTVGSENLKFSYVYNNKNQLSKVTYPNQLSAEYTYDNYGHQTALSVNGTTAWTVKQFTGSSFTRTLRNNTEENIEFDVRGRMTKRTDGSVTSAQRPLLYTYDDQTGNVMTRFGFVPSPDFWEENFSYDALDRLKTVAIKNLRNSTGSSNEVLSITYDNDGNISSKSNIGNYTYSSSHPHAVSGVQYTSGLIPINNQSLVYNGFGKVSSISEDAYQMTFDYGPDHERWSSVLKQNGKVTRTIVYAGDYEKVTQGKVTRHFYYLPGDVVCVKTGSGTPEIFHALKDNLGSYVAFSGFHAVYDAWGNQTILSNDINFHRGYTGHEMMPEFGLINMNGRLYDPRLGRFLSPDNYVQIPDFAQNYNRYSYCLNNPLKYNDPSGDLFGIDDVFIAFAVINAGNSMMRAAYNDQNIWKAGGLSLLSSAVSYVVGSAFGGIGNFGHELLRAGAHGLSNGLTYAINGNGFGPGFVSGSLASLAGSGAQSLNFGRMGVLASSIGAGALGSYISGGDWLDGAMSGFSIGLYNHMSHMTGDGYNVRKIGKDTYEALESLPEVVIDGIKKAPWGVDALSIAFTTYANSRYHKSWSGKEFWRTRSGKTYDSSILQRQSNGKYVRGVQGIRVSRDLAKRAVRVPSALGRISGRIGVGLNLINTIENPTTGNIIDLGRSILSYYSLPYAAMDLYISISIESASQIQQFNLNNGLPLNQGLYNPTFGQYIY